LTQYYDTTAAFHGTANSAAFLRILRAMETVGCVNVCVCVCWFYCQQFMQDCSDVMQLLLKTQTEMQDMPEDDPQVC